LDCPFPFLVGVDGGVDVNRFFIWRNAEAWRQSYFVRAERMLYLVVFCMVLVLDSDSPELVKEWTGTSLGHGQRLLLVKVGCASCSLGPIAHWGNSAAEGVQGTCLDLLVAVDQTEHLVCNIVVGE
jgi:hypothetical protein